MSNSLFYDLFVNCNCNDCRYGEYHSDRDQFYCNHPCSYCKWHDVDDNNPCTYFEKR